MWGVILVQKGGWIMKKILSLTIAIVMLFLLVACSATSGDNNGSNVGSNASSNASSNGGSGGFVSGSFGGFGEEVKNEEGKVEIMPNEYIEVSKTTSKVVAMDGVSGVSGSVATAKIFDQSTGKSAGAFKSGDLGYFSVYLKSADLFSVVKVAICDSTGRELTSMDFKITSQATNTCLRFTATRSTPSAKR